ncbi:hypothetical protein ANO11243_017940 [Dothideomycetidae sp. 11243]|nr:hypothetical protein ANO11243_017940 [fungal sp. No.11243]
MMRLLIVAQTVLTLAGSVLGDYKCSTQVILLPALTVIKEPGSTSGPSYSGDPSDAGSTSTIACPASSFPACIFPSGNWTTSGTNTSSPKESSNPSSHGNKGSKAGSSGEDPMTEGTGSTPSPADGINGIDHGTAEPYASIHPSSGQDTYPGYVPATTGNTDAPQASPSSVTIYTGPVAEGTGFKVIANVPPILFVAFVASNFLLGS